MDERVAKTLKWLVSVPAEVNVAARVHLAQSGGRKGDLSKFVVEAVQNEIARRTVAQVRVGNAGAGIEEAQRAVRAAVAAVRAERWPGASK